MVYREIAAYGGSRMNVDSGFAMCHFGYDAWDKGYAEHQQFVRYTVVADGANGGIAADDFTERMGGWIAVVSGFHICCQYAAQFGQMTDEPGGD